MSVDFKSLRESYSLSFFFENTMGATSKNVSGSARYSACPNCGTSSDTSVKCSVRNNKWHCFSCEDRGDVIDAASKFFGLPPAQAAKQLANDTAPAPARRLAPVVLPRVDRDQNAINEVIEKLLNAQGSPDIDCLTYLAWRGISKQTVEAAVQRQLIVTLPGDANIALRYILDVVGRELLIKAGIWKDGSKAPAILYRPLAFVSSNRRGIEFRLIRSSDIAMAKAIRYGEPAPWVWNGNDQAMLVEGGIDMLSAIELGSQRTIYSLPGAKNWNENDRWLMSLRGKNVLLAFDADESGRRGALELETILKRYETPLKHHKHPAGCKDLNDQLKQRLGLI